jgi:hypothetical protein
MQKTERALGDLDVAVGPHPARPSWHVLRVSFNGESIEQKARIGEAIRALYAPRPEPIGTQVEAGGTRR